MPLPDDIIHKQDNDIGYSKYNDINKLKNYEEELNFYKHVAEHYDNNDFIIMAGLDLYSGVYDADQLEKYYISLEVRKRVHEFCDEIEKSIEELKNDK